MHKYINVLYAQSRFSIAKMVTENVRAITPAILWIYYASAKNVVLDLRQGKYVKRKEKQNMSETNKKDVWQLKTIILS